MDNCFFMQTHVDGTGGFVEYSKIIITKFQKSGDVCSWLWRVGLVWTSPRLSLRTFSCDEKYVNDFRAPAVNHHPPKNNNAY